MPTPPPANHRVLVKLRPSTALRAAEARAAIQPLFEGAEAPAARFGMEAAPRWFIADLPAAADSPWDLAHATVAGQLGIAETDIVFAEPDIVHPVYPSPDETPPGMPFAAGESCRATEQDGTQGKPKGPDVYGWHLGDDFSQLESAREAVGFSDPRTRIAHLDTGYYPRHVTTPARVLRDLERNFVSRDDDPRNAEDPDNRRLLLDNSGHGTGTLGILAGGVAPVSNGKALGGAPDAEIVPVRVADSVVLLRTSALARAFAYAVEASCDVVTLSMGGLPTAAWEDAVDRAYEAGVCICAAAGNHIGPAPPHRLVYPARYSRVIAVCGVMADGRPYKGLKGKTLEGSFGPPKAMGSAIAAYTPNIPWPRFGCPESVRLDGQGTSSATPQVAAAVALWLEKHKGELPRDWQRVEAVRHALFSTAKLKEDREHFGNGVLQARAALGVRPRLHLPKSPRSDSSFAFLRLVTGLGLLEPTSRERMFNLELAQRWLLNETLQGIVPDPEAAVRLEDDDLRRFMEAVVEDEGASLALRRHVAARYPVHVGGLPPRTPQSRAVVPAALPACEQTPSLTPPPYRRLRVYAIDPSRSRRFDTAAANEVTLRVRWEPLEKGPKGKYLEIEDLDAAGIRYDPVDLDDPRLLARDGWEPSEGNPQFHQQMVYAVAMNTIDHFERSLGRPVLWRPRPNPQKPHDDSRFVERLAVRPHALRQANAFYSPDQVALQFGYFEVGDHDPGNLMPGSRIYSCLSHDIVVHETTHAILDGMHRRFSEPSNPDVLALHEAFADIVALLQHFTIPEVLEHEIARTRGDLEAESVLGSLAVEFGQATGGRGALRQAIGRVENGVWRRIEADPRDLAKRLTPHSRGAVLVGAIFDAFLTIYKARIADLLRISTGGTGVLAAGAIHPDLAHRLASEASKAAGHVLGMCIRALDYLPPVDVTFVDYLRALITADFDLVADDRHRYRVAFVEAFRRRAIYPSDLDSPESDSPRTLAADTLRWRGLDRSTLRKGVSPKVLEQYRSVRDSLQRFADQCFRLDDRRTLFDFSRATRRSLHREIKKIFATAPEFAVDLRLDPARPFEVHDLRPALRVSPGGRIAQQVIVVLTQSVAVPADRQTGTPRFIFRGGSTLVIDLADANVAYRIFKNIASEDRRQSAAAFVRAMAADPLRALFFSPERREPFAALHALADEGL